MLTGRWVPSTWIALATLGVAAAGSAGAAGLDVIASTGDDAPDGAGVLGDFIGAPVACAHGGVVYQALIDGVRGGAEEMVVVLRTDASADVVMRTGDPSPDGDGDLGSFGTIMVTADGVIASSVMLTGTSDPASSLAFIVHDGGSASLAARLLDAAPGGPGSFDAFCTSSLCGPAFSSDGRLAFRAELTGATATSDAGVFIVGPSGVDDVARSATVAFPTSNGAPRINHDGMCVLRASLPATGVYVGDGTTLTPVATVGTTSPAGGQYAQFGQPSICDDGLVAFSALLTGAGPTTSGIFQTSGDGVAAVVLAGDPLPGGGSFIDFEPPQMNAAGDLAFLAEFADAHGVRCGVFARIGGMLVEIAREGDPLPDDALLAFDAFTRPPVLSAGGDVAFLATTAGRRGLYLYDSGADAIIAVARERHTELLGSEILAIDFDTEDNGSTGLGATGEIAFRFFLFEPEGRSGVALWRPAGCAGDANGDGLANAADLSVIIGSFGQAVGPGTSGDLNGDGVVNGADLSVLIGDFGCG